MKTAVAIRHVPFEGLGSFVPVLSERGYKVRYLEAATDNLGPIIETPPDLLVVLGGPIGADQQKIYPFLLLEQEIIARRLVADQPTLGICLGAQLLARAGGAQTMPAGATEIGWEPLTLSVPGEVSCLAPVNGFRCFTGMGIPSPCPRARCGSHQAADAAIRRSCSTAALVFSFTWK